MKIENASVNSGELEMAWPGLASLAWLSILDRTVGFTVSTGSEWPISTVDHEKVNCFAALLLVLFSFF